MAIKLRTFLLFLHLLLLQEMVMLGEAALCEAPSTLFRGACFSNRNCANICEKEGFSNGRCKNLKCKCIKDCNGGGGGGGGGGSGGGGPPDEGPPNEGPPDSGGSPPDSSESPPTEGTPAPNAGGSPPSGGHGPPNKGPPCDHPRPPSARPLKTK